MSQSTVTRRDMPLASAPPATIIPTPSPEQATPRGGWLRNALPTIAVVAVLGVLAAWGHQTNWTLPRFSELMGKQQGPVDDWCQEHNVAESACIECVPGLLPALKDHGWCAEHGIAQCPLEHPEVAQLKTMPTITPEDRERAQLALTLRPRPENNSRCVLHQRRIQFASIEAMDKAGVDISVVGQRQIIEAITANGEVVYDETRLAHLASRVTGTVRSVHRQVGDHVRQGEVLALVDSIEIGRAKADFQQAISQLRLKQTHVDRLKPLTENGAVAGRQVREAESALQEAEIRLAGAQQTLENLGLPLDAADFSKLSIAEIGQRLRLLGLPDNASVTSDPATNTSNLFPLRAPLDGVVVARHVVAGEVVDTSTTLFTIADLRQMWLTLAVPQEEARYLAIGQNVLFRSSDSRDSPEVTGSLAWISTEADDQTRTVGVRVNLPNADGRLRANTFGTGRIVLRAEPKATVVPSEAVHWDGDCSVVFVRDKNFLKEGAPKFFHIRKVRVGVKEADVTEIIVGLLPGEVIASKNSVVLEAQLLKSNLGAGCGCAHGH